MCFPELNGTQTGGVTHTLHPSSPGKKNSRGNLKKEEEGSFPVSSRKQVQTKQKKQRKHTGNKKKKLSPTKRGHHKNANLEY